MKANDTADDFGIGASNWPGIAKLMEEAAEVIQVCAKLVATGGLIQHWSGDDLSARLVEELGDLTAALQYVHAHNPLSRLDWRQVEVRAETKFDLFQEWDQYARRGLYTCGLPGNLCTCGERCGISGDRSGSDGGSGGAA